MRYSKVKHDKNSCFLIVEIFQDGYNWAQGGRKYSVCVCVYVYSITNQHAKRLLRVMLYFRVRPYHIFQFIS